MHLGIALATLVMVVPSALAEELRTGDVPPACTAICEPIVSLTSTCDVDPNEADKDGKKRKMRYIRERTDSDEAIEAACICNNKSFNVPTVMALCASCISQNGRKTKDADKIMSQCSFSSISYAASATTIVSDIRVQATKPATTQSQSQTSPAGAASPTQSKTSGATRMGRPFLNAIGLGCTLVLSLNAL